MKKGIQATMTRKIKPRNTKKNSQATRRKGHSSTKKKPGHDEEETNPRRKLAKPRWRSHATIRERRSQATMKKRGHATKEIWSSQHEGEAMLGVFEVHAISFGGSQNIHEML